MQFHQNMKKKMFFILNMLLVFGMLGCSDGTLKQPPSNYSIPDTKEAKDIMKTIEKAYDIESGSRVYL
jgi:hypothetical protein